MPQDVVRIRLFPPPDQQRRVAAGLVRLPRTAADAYLNLDMILHSLAEDCHLAVMERGDVLDAPNHRMTGPHLHVFLKPVQTGYSILPLNVE